MKTKLFTLLLAVAAGLGTVWASDTSVNGIWYDFDTSTKTASVTYRGSSYDYYLEEYSGKVVIPSSVEYNSVTYSVTSIGNYAFYGCKGLTSITIPNSVTSIGNYAFSYCRSLSFVTIPNSVTSIGNCAFYDCRSLTSPVYNAHVFAFMPTSYSGAYTIPDGIESIAGSAFSGCSGLTAVTIPGSVTSIGEYAFTGCSGLTSPVYNTHVFAYMPTSYSGAYTIPDGIESIAGYAFSSCSSLTSVTIPNSFTSIGNDAFRGCSGLTSVTIPNSVTSIGDRAFYECYGLTSVTIPNSVTSIGNYAFYYCANLTSVTIGNSVTSIGDYAFLNCTGLKSVTIPNSVTSIGDGAFYECWSLASPVYNTHVFAFMPTSYSGAYAIPDGIESIACSAFSGCRGLTSVTIPNSVTSIGSLAFSGCRGLTSPVYNAHVFAYMPTSYSGAYTIPDGIESIAGYAFSSCSSLTSVTIPGSVTSIGDYTFYNCSGLTSVTIEADTPPTIGIYCFYYKDNYGKYFPMNISIYVPCGSLDTYKTAEGWSYYASRIKYAPLPYKIFTQAENGGVATTDVVTISICEPFVTCTATPDYGYHFTQWSDGLKDNPRIAQITQDTTFTAEFAIDKSGTCGKNNLLHWTFADDGTLTISGSGELTENYTFGVEAPTQMQQLVVGNEVTAIGERAFYEKTTLQKLIIGSNVTSIGKYAFASINNRQLTSLVMPAELLTIGDYAFSGNTYLESIDLNAKLQSIGAYAFKDCYRVSEMTCLATVTPNVGTDALASINSYASLCVPAECLRKYQIDLNWGRFDLCELGTTSTVTENRTVTVEPTDNTAIFTWPTENNAASYSLQITKDGVVFCTLVFNSNGQLTGIAFAPGRNGVSHTPAATTSVAGMSFTVTGLNTASKYAYHLVVKDENQQDIQSYSGEFATMGYTGEINPGGEPELNPTGTEDIQVATPSSKLLRDGHIFILRGDKTYTLQGQEVR